MKFVMYSILCIFVATAKHWRCVERYAKTIQCSLVDAQKREIEEENTVSALASLSMVAANRRYVYYNNLGSSVAHWA